MKSKLFIPGLLISIAMLTFSCTNDDYEIPEKKSSQLKIVPNEQLKNLNEKIDAKAQDLVKKNTIPEINLTTVDNGDPDIARPTRKD